MADRSRRYQGILLLGPTGAGKSPLGDRIEAAGMGGRPFRHFDFGAQLRRAVIAAESNAAFSDEELRFLRHVLESGALLEDEHFPLAERILRSFLDRNCGGGLTQIVLNGLPRHVGQAEAVARIVHVRAVVLLECPAEVVEARIGSNVGGDRTERSDDRHEDIRRKLEIFRTRTEPLIEYYCDSGTPSHKIRVTAQMTAADAWECLQKRMAGSS